MIRGYSTGFGSSLRDFDSGVISSRSCLVLRSKDSHLYCSARRLLLARFLGKGSPGPGAFELDIPCANAPLLRSDFDLDDFDRAYLLFSYF